MADFFINVNKSRVTTRNFALAVTVSDLSFEMFDLDNLDHGDRVQYSQFCQSVAYINLYRPI